MPNPSFLHALTLRCRALMEIATELETIDQLRLWAVELADQARKAGRRAVGENVEKHPMGTPAAVADDLSCSVVAPEAVIY